MSAKLFAFEVQFTDLELNENKKQLNEKIESNLLSYLGKTKFNAFLNFNTEKVESEVTENKIKSLYLIEDNTFTKKSEKITYKIISANVKVIIFRNSNKQIDKAVNEIISSAMDGIKTKVSVSYIENPPEEISQEKINEAKALEAKALEAKALEAQKKAQAESVKPPIPAPLAQKTKEERKLYEMLDKHFSDIILVIGIFFIGSIIYVSVLKTLSAFKNPLNSISESVKNYSSVKIKHENTQESSPADQSNYDKFFDVNIDGIKKLIKEKPDLICDFILTSGKNAAGLKKILPYISEPELMNLLKLTLKDYHISAMESSDYFFENQKLFFQWVDEATAQLILLSIQNKNNVLNFLEEEEISFIKKLNGLEVKKYVDQRKNPVSYQIALDLLQGKNREDFMQQMGIEDWKNVFPSSILEKSDVDKEVKRMISYFNNTKSEDKELTASSIQENLVLPNLLNLIKLKKLKEQDQFLESLSTISADTVALIREKFWTPKCLMGIPPKDLKKFYRDADFDTKIALLKAVPEDVKQYLLSEIIDGKIKGILEDSLKSPGKMDDSHERQASEFLKNIHEEFKKGFVVFNDQFDKKEFISNKVAA